MATPWQQMLNAVINSEGWYYYMHFINAHIRTSKYEYPHKKVGQDLTEKKQDLIDTSKILMVLTEI